MAAKINPSALVQEVDIGEDDLKFKTPFSMCVSGASMSGKTEFILKLIKHQRLLFEVNFNRIVYCEPESLVLRHNTAFDRLKEMFPAVELVEGIPDVAKLQLTLDSRPALLIIDDLMDAFLNSEAMVKLLSVEVHHFNISTIFTLQNFFAPSKFGKTISRNVNYRCIFYNRLDLREIRTISSQISHQPRFLLESFDFLHKNFPNEPPYLIIDGHIKSPLKELFVRSHIFPTDNNERRPLFFFPN